MKALILLLPVLAFATPQLDVGLVADLALDGNSYDMSGNGNNGRNEGVSWTTDRHGNENRAASFNGESYIQLNNRDILHGTTSAAITGWFNAQSGNTGFLIGAGNTREGRDPFAMAVNSSEVVQALFAQTTRGKDAWNREVGLDSTIAISTGWNSFTMQFASSEGLTIFQFYLNGTLVKETVAEYDLTVEYDSEMPVQIGAMDSCMDSMFTGYIDDLRIYNRTLTQEEINVLADLPATDSEATMFMAARSFSFLDSIPSVPDNGATVWLFSSIALFGLFRRR